MWNEEPKILAEIIIFQTHFQKLGTTETQQDTLGKSEIISLKPRRLECLRVVIFS